MRKLLIVALLLNIVCLFAICQPVSVLAGSGSGGGSDPCGADATKYALDSNDDGAVDLSDFVYGLSWLFSGGAAPRVCLDTTDLEASLAQAEEERDAVQLALGTAEGERDVALGERDAAQAAQATAEGERDTAQTAQATAEGERDVALGERDAAETALETANGQVTTLTGERDAAQAAQATAQTALETAEDALFIAEGALTACLAPPAPPAGSACGLHLRRDEHRRV